jgi:hypothetical protein
MAEGIATVGGYPAASLSVRVPGIGPWYADVDLDDEVSGEVEIAIGSVSLTGTVMPSRSGVHRLKRPARIVAGAGTLLPAKAYHNDAGIRARTVVEDAVREAGETLGDFLVTTERVGIDYVRRSGPASMAIEDVIGGTPWWVGYDGRTHVGARAETPAVAGSYQVLDYDPRTRIVTLEADDLSQLAIGSVLSDGLDEPQTVRELELETTGDAFRIKAWCGTEETTHGRLERAIRAIVTRCVDGLIVGPRRYRVVRMSGDRVELQAVRRAAGLPDILPISMWAGVAGVHAELAASAEVLVEFIDGLPTAPIITHFAGKDGTGWTPTSVTLSASGASASIKLGANATKKLAYADDVHEELVKVQAALAAAVAPPGGGTVTYPPGTNYTAPASGTDIGTAKAVAE